MGNVFIDRQVVYKSESVLIALCIFEFVIDKYTVELESVKAISQEGYEEYLKLTPAQRSEKIHQLQDLIEEPLQSDEQKARLWKEMGLLYHAEEDYTKALASYDLALKFNPDYHYAWYNKARCYALQGNIESSLENLQQALNLDEKYREIVKTNPDFDSIRSDERFQALVGFTKISSKE